MRQLLGALILAAGPVAADTLTGAEIVEALTGRDLIYENGATQDFRQSGRTLYNAGAPSWGYWEVRADQYCSLWPPGAEWDCYDVEAAPEGVTFVGRSGDRTTGRYGTAN